MRRRDRSHRREARGQARTVPRIGKAAGARRGDRHQYLLAVGDRNRRRLRQAGARRRPAFLQSAAVDAAGRGDRRPAHRSRRGRGHGRLFAPDQEASGGRDRHARLCGQSRRPRLWAGSAAHRRARHRRAARGRSADEGSRRLPHGAVRAARSGRRRRRPRGDGEHLQSVFRRADVSALGRDGGARRRRAARAQDQAGLLRLFRPAGGGSAERGRAEQPKPASAWVADEDGGKELAELLNGAGVKAQLGGAPGRASGLLRHAARRGLLRRRRAAEARSGQDRRRRHARPLPRPAHADEEPAHHAGGAGRRLCRAGRHRRAGHGDQGQPRLRDPAAAGDDRQYRHAALPNCASPAPPTSTPRSSSASTIRKGRSPSATRSAAPACSPCSTACMPSRSIPNTAPPPGCAAARGSACRC